MDDIDEEEGRKLDMALSEAFKSAQKSPTKNKKQSASDKALTNFRIRYDKMIDSKLLFVVFPFYGILSIYVL